MIPHLTALGIVFGLCAAASQSASYLYSRLFVVRRGTPHAVFHLLIVSHLLMGGASLVLLPFAWLALEPSLTGCSIWVLGAGGFYLIGQAGLFFLMRSVQASRIAPLLSLKLVVLAMISAGFLDSRITAGQWAAVVLCVGAAFILNSTGAPLSLAGWTWLAFTCVAYSLSDLSIERLVSAMRPMPPVHAAFLGACLTYVFCGAAACAALPFVRVADLRRDLNVSAPFALFWLLGMLFLFGCFGTVGAVFGNILQSTRGLISILVGAWLARRGMLLIEDRVDRWTLARRVAAALTIVVAIYLFARDRT